MEKKKQRIIRQLIYSLISIMVVWALVPRLIEDTRYVNNVFYLFMFLFSSVLYALLPFYFLLSRYVNFIFSTLFMWQFVSLLQHLYHLNLPITDYDINTGIAPYIKLTVSVMYGVSAMVYLNNVRQRWLV